MSTESVTLDVALRQAVADVVAGSEWAPPDGGIVTNVVVLMEWMAPDDDDQSMSWYRTGSRYMAEGMLRSALRQLDVGAGRIDEEDA